MIKHFKKTVGTTTALAVAITLLIQPWEGRVYKPYKDSGGVWTVCDGHTGSDIIIDKIYTDPECDALTAKDAKIAEAVVDRNVKYPITLYTKAALISFVYNIGGSQFATSTLLKILNAGDVVGACNQLSRWVFVNQKAIQGLRNRRYLGDVNRMSERELCLKGAVS